MNTEAQVKAVVLLKDQLCDGIDWRTKFTWEGSISEFKLTDEYVYRVPTSNSIYLFVGFLMFWSVGMVIQGWSNLSDLVLSLLSMLFLLLTGFMTFLYLRKNQFDFHQKTYERHILGISGFKLLRIEFEEVKALQLMKIDRDQETHEHYEMYLIKTDDSRVFIACMSNRFYFFVAAMNIHSRSNIPLWMNKWC